MKNLSKYYYRYFKYSLKSLITKNENRIRYEKIKHHYQVLIDYFKNTGVRNLNSVYIPYSDPILLEKPRTASRYKKNAVLIYSYEPEMHSVNYYDAPFVNIGDYIQSLAAKQYFAEENVEYVDRDNVCYYKSDEVNLIANGWYHFYEGNEIFSDKINPLFVSFHINNVESVTERTLAYLRQKQPIGCRDYATRDFLVSHNIDAYFSSCLTTTLQSYAVDKKERKDKIVFCDYDDSDYFIRKIIDDIVGDIETEKTTHRYEKGLSHDAYFEEAKRLINIYARSGLVVTTRIHCALPCLALKTPVILCVPHYDKKRFKGLDQMLNIVGYDEDDNLFIKICYDPNGNIVNPSNYEAYANELKRICTSFAKNDC